MPSLVPEQQEEEEAPPAVGLEHYHRTLHNCEPNYKHTFEQLSSRLTPEEEAEILRRQHHQQQQQQPPRQLRRSSSVSSNPTSYYTEADGPASAEEQADAATGADGSIAVPSTKELHEHSLEDSARLDHVASREPTPVVAASSSTNTSPEASPRSSNQESAASTAATTAHSAPSPVSSPTKGGAKGAVLPDMSVKRKPSLEERVEGHLRKGFGKFMKQPGQVQEGTSLLSGRGHVGSKLARQQQQSV